MQRAGWQPYCPAFLTILIMDNLAIISTDHHLNADNAPVLKKILLEEIDVAEQNGTKRHIWLGDVFDNRMAQRQICLNTLHEVLEHYDQSGHTILCIPGNHDKTLYAAKESFLTSFKHHPSIQLIEELEGLNIDGVYCYFIPFFVDEVLLEFIGEIGDKKKKQVLFGHFAVTGSRNNDGSLVENKISPTLLGMFEKVYLGHYHDFQTVGSNIFHLGSIQQNNFGEDDKKGFWLFKRDLSVERIPSAFATVFKKLEIDLDATPHKQAMALVEKFRKENSQNRIRVEVWGNQSSLDAFDKESLVSKGIDVKKKFKEMEIKSAFLNNTEVRALGTEDIEKKFKDFCKENKYPEKEGSKILKKVLYGEEEGN